MKARIERNTLEQEHVEAQTPRPVLCHDEVSRFDQSLVYIMPAAESQTLDLPPARTAPQQAHGYQAQMMIFNSI